MIPMTNYFDKGLGVKVHGHDLDHELYVFGHVLRVVCVFNAIQSILHLF